ncbi:MAG: N,N-dimethylformamidase beta subunit family domain-containing protein [Flavobacteriales bacterium]
MISFKPEAYDRSSTLDVYTDKLAYRAQDTVHVFIHSKAESIAVLRPYGIEHQKDTILSFQTKANTQELTDTQAEFGCQWTSAFKFVLDEDLEGGFYQIDLQTETETRSWSFLLEQRKPSKIAVLFPLSTWVAYNQWGGKSLYINALENKTTYFASSQRPNPELQIPIEQNIASYFKTEHQALLLADYALETDKALLESVDVIILASHCEYFSETMYQNLEDILQSGVNLISMGGNQIYWKIKWNKDHKTMECRKDLTHFSDQLNDYGGMWRHHFQKAEHRLLGNQFTDAGMHTYAPYEVRNAEHWIYEGLDLKNGTIFGEKGARYGRPLSGDELDKIETQDESITLLAKGLNGNPNYTFPDLDKSEIGAYGADFVLKTHPNFDVLSTGSITSGDGLGFDTVFTQLIENFIQHSTEHSTEH